MPNINPQNNPLVFMSFLSQAQAIRFIQPTDDWQETRNNLVHRFSRVSDADFILLLGDESLLTDSAAEFVIYTKDDQISLEAETLRTNNFG